MPGSKEQAGTEYEVGVKPELASSCRHHMKSKRTQEGGKGENEKGVLVKQEGKEW
jgi:hypothetical protein